MKVMSDPVTVSRECAANAIVRVCLHEKAAACCDLQPGNLLEVYKVGTACDGLHLSIDMECLVFIMTTCNETI